MHEAALADRRFARGHAFLSHERSDLAGIREIEHRGQQRHAGDGVLIPCRQYGQRRREQRATHAEAERVHLVWRGTLVLVAKQAEHGRLQVVGEVDGRDRLTGRQILLAGDNAPAPQVTHGIEALDAAADEVGVPPTRAGANHADLAIVEFERAVRPDQAQKERGEVGEGADLFAKALHGTLEPIESARGDGEGFGDAGEDAVAVLRGQGSADAAGDDPGGMNAAEHDCLTREPACPPAAGSGSAAPTPR